MFGLRSHHPRPLSPQEAPTQLAKVIPVNSGARGRLAPLDLQRLWLSARKRPWTTLAVLPTCVGASAWELAEALAATAEQFGQPLAMVDAEDLQPRDVDAVLARMKPRQAGAVLVVVEPLGQCMASLPVVRAAEAVLLVVPLGEADLASARETIDLVGRETIVGCAALEARRDR